jgi:hypothetical protein
VPPAEIPDRIAVLTEECRRAGRDIRDLSLAVSVPHPDPGLLPELASAGITELVIVAEPPAEPATARDWVSQLAAQWLSG